MVGALHVFSQQILEIRFPLEFVKKNIYISSKDANTFAFV